LLESEVASDGQISPHMEQSIKSCGSLKIKKLKLGENVE
jgi:hypothetical protein